MLRKLRKKKAVRPRFPINRSRIRLPLGPLVGGPRFHLLLSYHLFHHWSTLLIVFFLSLFLVHEHFVPIESTEGSLTAKDVVHKLNRPQAVFGMFITTMIIQASNNSIAPIISLYVKELMHNGAGVTMVAGLIAAIPGIANMLAAPRGELGDRIGTEKILSVAFLFAMVLYVPMAFVPSVFWLGVFRFFIGISDGAMLPACKVFYLSEPLRKSPDEFSVGTNLFRR